MTLTIPGLAVPLTKFLSRWKSDAQFLRELGIAWLDQDRAIRKENGGHAALPVIEFLDDLHCFGILVDIHVFVLDLVFVQELLGAPAIGTPDCA